MKTVTSAKTGASVASTRGKDDRAEKKGNRTRGIVPCLWFDNQAEEAANFYVSVFKNSKIQSVSRYGEAGAEVSGRPEGSVMAVTFELDGQDFMALNGGPMFKLTPAISFMVSCETQSEVDRYWDTLCAGGEPMECGWITDKFGVTWQIVPAVLDELLGDKDTHKSERVMKALLQMRKLDIEALMRAAEEK